MKGKTAVLGIPLYQYRYIPFHYLYFVINFVSWKHI